MNIYRADTPLREQKKRGKNSDILLPCYGMLHLGSDSNLWPQPCRNKQVEDVLDWKFAILPTAVNFNSQYRQQCQEHLQKKLSWGLRWGEVPSTGSQFPPLPMREVNLEEMVMISTPFSIRNLDLQESIQWVTSRTTCSSWHCSGNCTPSFSENL